MVYNNTSLGKTGSEVKDIVNSISPRFHLIFMSSDSYKRGKRGVQYFTWLFYSFTIIYLATSLVKELIERKNLGRGLIFNLSKSVKFYFYSNGIGGKRGNEGPAAALLSKGLTYG